MANTHPQVIIVWGMPGQQVMKFLEMFLTDSRTSSAYIMTCFPLQQMVFRVYYKLAMDGKLTPVAGQIVSSASSLPVSYEAMNHVHAFRADMGQYIEKSGRVDEELWADEAEAVRRFGPRSHELSAAAPPAEAAKFFREHPSTAQLMFSGWVTGVLIMDTVNQPIWIMNRSTYMAGLYDQNRYVIGSDIVIGDYGGPCTSVAQFLGAICNCNQGGRGALLQSLESASWSLIPNTVYSYGQSVCYVSTIALSEPLNVLTLSFSDLPRLIKASAEINTVIPKAIDKGVLNFSGCNLATLNVSRTTAQGALDWEFLNYSVDLITGPLLRSVDVSGALVISPVFNRPNTLVPKSNYLFLMPTLEQEMYLLYLKMEAVTAVTSIGANVHIVLHEYDRESVQNITELALKTAASFDLPDPSVVSVSTEQSVERSLVPRRINFVLGLTGKDITDIARFLSVNPSTLVVVSSVDLAHSYKALVDALSQLSSSVQERLLSFNSLPLWSDNSESARETQPLLKLFHSIFPHPANHTPSLLRDLLAITFIQAVSTTKEGVLDSASLEESIYTTGIITTHTVSLGRFQWGCTSTSRDDECIYRNYGAQNIAMLSMQRMLNPKVPQLTSPTTPSMVYRPRSRSGALTPAQRRGIIFGSIVSVVAIIAGCAMLLYFCIDGRDNDAAPKDGDEPVTLIFTDIESSTALWAALPQLMTDAVAAHHRVIRQLIGKYKCYEVKTIGDSFMIACKDAHGAVCLACEIQTRLLGHDWGTECIDGAYREFELGRVDMIDDYEPPTARLSEEEYAALWRGLRVRVGIHTGLSDIRYDEVTKGYDYYGDTSNMAARTEAVANGGQVIATETTWWALSNDERAAVAHTVMGPQGLRGVPFAVEMFQLNAVPGRRHAALRTEVEAILPDETATETASSGAGALLSSVGTMTGPAAGIALMLSSCFAPYPVAQRVRELQPLLSKWGVGAPPRSRLVSEEDYCQGLVNRLAIRIATVTQARQRMGNNGAAGAGDVQGIGACGVLNPFMCEGGSVSDGAKSRPSGMAVSQRSEEPSAMRESRVCRRSTGRGSLLSRGAGSKKDSCSVSTVGFHDDVMPFASQASRRASEELDAHSVSASMSGEVVVVRMPRNLVRCHRPNAVESTSEKVVDEAKLGGGGADRPQLWGW
ncbi:hypothetical protein CUR178_05981 [Leishmania enriettii]|uniref:adenylate cyclase n=1 Tax=Leishmania enriettii TaxID=5663 RepID=A0A836GZR1_LEIEN|nr:hypothetical protein CUR178_05981 [Leishmania enriettii]